MKREEVNHTGGRLGVEGRSVRRRICSRRHRENNLYCRLMIAKRKSVSHSERLHLKARPDAIIMQICKYDYRCRKVHTFLQQFLKASIVSHCTHKK